MGGGGDISPQLMSLIANDSNIAYFLRQGIMWYDNECVDD